MYTKVNEIAATFAVFGLSTGSTTLLYTSSGMAGWTIIRLLMTASTIRP